MEEYNEFQLFAIENYVRDYYKAKDTKFIRLVRPKGISKDFIGIPTTNFDAEYINTYFNDVWKINFLIGNNCIIKTLNIKVSSKGKIINKNEVYKKLKVRRKEIRI